MDFGAFCELEPGLTTLLHSSELSWTKKNISAKKMFKIGDEIEYTIKNAEYKNASLIVENNYNAPINTNQNKSISMRATTNDSILLQVCYKENMQAFGKENRGSVINNTKEDFISLKQILNNL